MTSEVQIRNPDVEPEAQITVTGSARLHTYLRRESYYLAMYLLKQETKALEGNPISGEFVANLLTRLQPHSKKLARVGHEVTFETYFEVREEQS
jgi:hypothetical protein